jgi:hypothetical protein
VASCVVAITPLRGVGDFVTMALDVVVRTATHYGHIDIGGRQESAKQLAARCARR